MKLSSSLRLKAWALSALAITTTPSELSTSGPPLVEPRALEILISSERLLNHARQLVKFSKLSNGTRAFGSKGHNATVEYIESILDRTGYYDTYLQSLPYLYTESKVQFSVGGAEYPTKSFSYGPGGDATAPLAVVDVFGCVAADFPPTVSGSIALIKRGVCQYGLKVALAGAAGASGAIIYNDADGEWGSGGTLAQPTRPEGPYVPVGAISGLAGNALISKIAAGFDVIGFIHAESIFEERYSSNVIATTKQGDKENVVFAGGHSDSVPAGAGINDDGSGIIALLEVALQLPKFAVKNAVRFGFWTAEEFGLVGSAYHIRNLSDEERQRIALYLNFDMIASPNSGYFIYDGDGSAYNITGPPGSAQIERLFQDYYKGRGLITGSAQFSGRSDYGPFLEVGIPSGGVNTGADGIKTTQGAEWWGGIAGEPYDKCYHAKCDGIENLRVDVWLHNAQAIAHAIAAYATSLKGIPRETRQLVSGLHIDTLSYEDRRHYTCGHGIPVA